MKEGVVPTKYCERTNQNLCRANASSLSVSYKLRKGYISVQDYCFKNVFVIIKNITNDIILGTLFLTQIYPFYVNEIGIHIKVMDNSITFPFLSSTRQREISLLQKSSIFRQINTLQLKKNQRSHLKE